MLRLTFGTPYFSWCTISCAQIAEIAHNSDFPVHKSPHPTLGPPGSRIPVYWHALNVRGSTATVLPPTVSINAAVVCSDGEQSATPPDDGTNASPSIL